MTMTKTRSAGVAIALGLVASTVTLASPADAAATGIYKNCTALQKKWPHGVGTKTAVDKTSGVRVTSFYHNTNAYKLADQRNGGLDRDNDKIACEKR